MPTDPIKQQQHKPPDDGAPARALVRGTGRVFQAVGFAVLLIAVVTLGIGGLVHRPPSEMTGPWLDFVRGETLPAAILAIGAMAGIVGGLALAAAGLGMQAERIDASRLGLMVGLLLAVIYAGAAVVLVWKAGQWLPAMIAILIASGMLFLAILARRSIHVLHKFPPPPDRNVVTDEMLEQWRTERERLRAKQT